jgi:hypothetical protein
MHNKPHSEESKKKMREYKFRGKRIDNGEWVYGDYSASFRRSIGVVYHRIETRDIEYGCGSYPVDPDTVGQYTGLKDKNGVEIYEGDVLGKGNEKYEVKWGMGEPSFFALTNEAHCNCYSVHGLATHGAIVIGNIHDNPELIREATNETS